MYNNTTTHEQTRDVSRDAPDVTTKRNCYDLTQPTRMISSLASLWASDDFLCILCHVVVVTYPLFAIHEHYRIRLVYGRLLH